jgi:hypothetical protein
VTKSRTPNICRPTPAGRPAPGCLLSSSECTGGTQPPGGTGKRLACQEMTRPVRYCCLLPTGSLARLRIAADRPGHGAKVVHESGYARIVVMDSLVCPQASAQIQAVWISCRMSGCSRCLCSRGMSRIGPWVPGPATAAPPWPATALLPGELAGSCWSGHGALGSRVHRWPPRGHGRSRTAGAGDPGR